MCSGDAIVRHATLEQDIFVAGKASRSGTFSNRQDAYAKTPHSANEAHTKAQLPSYLCILGAFDFVCTYSDATGMHTCPDMKSNLQKSTMPMDCT